MLIGLRTSKDLATLLSQGYFPNGKQRITLKMEEGAPYPEVRLWDDWEKRQSHIYASDLTLVLEIARIDLFNWHWSSNNRECGGNT